MARQGNMYPLSVKQWNPWVGCKHDCTYCRPSFQAQLKRRKNDCLDCYDFAPHSHPTRLEAPSFPRTGFMQFIFTCSSGDIAFCPKAYLRSIMDVIRQHRDRTFLLQTKNPGALAHVELPSNVVLGITLETNRDALALAVSKAPPPSARYRAFKDHPHPTKMVTVEPVMDFDLGVMMEWVDEIAPSMVWLGYDSRSSGLTEPELAKVMELHWELGRKGYVVVLKTIREGRGTPRSPKPRGV